MKSCLSCGLFVLVLKRPVETHSRRRGHVASGTAAGAAPCSGGSTKPSSSIERLTQQTNLRFDRFMSNTSCVTARSQVLQRV